MLAAGASAASSTPESGVNVPTTAIAQIRPKRSASKPAIAVPTI
ncbi:MAG TPA: hypothetical protein VF909_02945 [Roseiflexaceae bacterium]